MTDATEQVKAMAAQLREGLRRADEMMAAERKAAAERAERRVAKRLPTIPDEDTWDEFGLD